MTGPVPTVDAGVANKPAPRRPTPRRSIWAKGKRRSMHAFDVLRVPARRRILELLADGPKSISDMVPIMYAAYDKRLWYPAVGSVWAHMQGLVDTGRVGTDDSPARRSSLFNRV